MNTEVIIRQLQTLVNKPFRYSELVSAIERHQAFLSDINIIATTPEDIYNAMWDTLQTLLTFFEFANNQHIIVISKINISKLYQYHLTQRTRKC